MPWARFDDNFHDNGKILSLSHGAFRLYVCAVTYCRRHRSTGLLSKEQAAALCGQQRIAKAAIAELVEKRAWHAVSNGFQIHDFEEYQPKGDETAAERMRRHRERGRNNERDVTPSDGDVTRNSYDPVPMPSPIPMPSEGVNPSALTLVRPAPKPSKAPKAQTVHGAVFDVLIAQFGTPGHRNERSQYGKAAALFTEAGVGAEEAVAVIEWAKAEWGVEPTPLSVANNLSTIRRAMRSPRRGKPRGHSVLAANGDAFLVAYDQIPEGA